MSTVTTTQAVALPVIAGTTSPFGSTVTFVAGTANTGLTWCGSSISLCIWPWYGTSVAAGGTATFTSVLNGTTMYWYSPTEPGTVTVTLN